MTQQKGSKRVTSVGIVTLHPPNGWHFSSISRSESIVGQTIDTGKYHLKKIGSRTTKLEAVFNLKRTARATAKIELLNHLNEIWEKYAAALEKDYLRKLG